MHNKNEKELEDLYLKSVGAVYLHNFLSEKNAMEQFLTDFDDSNYVKDFEEGYAEDFEDERKVEIFKQEQENTLSGFLTSPIFSYLTKEQPMGASRSGQICYVKPVFGEAEHP